MNDMDIIAAGSHLGLLKSSESFPVGKVGFLSMFTMTFREFLIAADPEAFTYLGEWIPKVSLPGPVHERLLDNLKTYFFTGGSPEAVSIWLKEYNNIPGALYAVRKTEKSCRRLPL